MSLGSVAFVPVVVGVELTTATTKIHRKTKQRLLVCLVSQKHPEIGSHRRHQAVGRLQ